MPEYHVTADGFFNWFANTADQLSLEQIEELLEDNVRLGYMQKAGKNEEGEQLFRLTNKGKQKAEGLLREITGGPE